MQNRINTSFKFSLFAFLAILLLLMGCARPTEVPPLPTLPPELTPQVTEDPPTPTSLPEKIVVVDQAGLLSDEVKEYLSTFGAEQNLALETINNPELPPQGAETRVVIFLAAPANLADIVSASPDTQFIVSGAVDLPTTSNLSVIQTRGEDLAFMGGFLTMQIAWDWRAGALIANDEVMAAEKVDAFENGARFVCGQCTPYYAPLVYFPLIGQEAMNTSFEAWDAQISVLAQNFVNSYYVDPAVATPEVLDRLIGLEANLNNPVHLVGLSTSAPDRFTALLGFDILPALQQLLPQVLTGGGGINMGAQVKIVTNNDDSVVTKAKVDNFNRMAADLASGIIIPLSIP